jgi:hypothetical protein
LVALATVTPSEQQLAAAPFCSPEPSGLLATPCSSCPSVIVSLKHGHDALIGRTNVTRFAVSTVARMRMRGM